MQRIIIVQWSKSKGPEPVIQYPPEKKFPSKDLFLKIWALHELDKESSIIEYIPDMPKSNNEQYVSMIQEYEGEIYFLVIAYDQNENIERIIKDFPDIFALVCKNLLELINTDKIPRAISEAFYTLKNYTQLEKEANLLNFFKDKIKLTILEILRKGIIPKNDLNLILRKEYGFSTLNIDLLIISFVRENLIVKKSIPGSSECYFLINDLIFIRIPPKSIPTIEDSSVLEDYKTKIVNFFENYDCTSVLDNINNLNLLIDDNCFNLLKKLRKGSLTVSETLDILNNDEDLFNELMDKQILFEAKGNVYPISDIRFIKFVPYYLIDKLSKRYMNHQISLDQYLAHLKLLTKNYKKYKSQLNFEII